MNKLTIALADNAVYVDGIAIVGLDLSFVPSDVHALQWTTDNGRIERVGQSDELIQSLPDWANQALALWNTTKAQLEAPVVLTDEQKIAAIKLNASSLLASSDWTMLGDVALTNKSDWTNYRAQLRAIVQNPQLNSVIPTLPQEIWS
jgi:hypothetical protein